MDRRKSDGSTFPIRRIMKPISESGQFPSPVKRGHISVDRKMNITFDESQMRYLKRPEDLNNVSLNLDDGYEDREEKSEENFEDIDLMIKWISEKLATSELNNLVVSRRCILTDIMFTPCKKYAHCQWKIAVILQHGAYHICRFDRNNRWEEVQKPHNRLWRKSHYWGWKMEQLLTESKPDESDCTKTQVQHGKYLLVNQLNINAHSLVFNCEIDAYDENTDSFVEIKTKKNISPENISPGEDAIFKKFTLLQWWAQSQLGGVKEILCGFRDNEGLVTRIESFRTSSIPNSELPWNQKVCFHFLDNLLTWIKKRVSVTGEFSANRIVHLFERSDEDTISHNTTTEPRYQFLPEWYLNIGEKGHNQH
ncbi:decapping and exoribonuclease protein-like isoform X1 [Dreissena polymorpha]|uniref:Decapping nuclease n=2 Tax=Dreissena polymorpha TaxID=45954 RepID=A0A9D3Y7K7_DREPO|nr:decapping and exoribonuclease protein-like isoform X1 [Dreissena polymorpha]KAH3694156.1 hypothetical protein DPMN_081595 [Dreissena polymorpha]